MFNLQVAGHIIHVYSMPTSNHFSHDAAKGPHVYSLGVVL